MKTQRLADYLKHMQEAASDARAFIEGMPKQDFLNDKKTQQAVIMSLLILGEAAGKALEHYPDFIAAHPKIAWKNIRGMRNRIAHGYFAIDLDIVWETVHGALPELQWQLARIKDAAGDCP